MGKPLTKPAGNGHLKPAMADDIPFNKNLDLAPDTVDEPDARRAPGDGRTIPARSPSRARSATSSAAARSPSSIPARTIQRHIGALLDAVRNETVTAIFVTHTHRDHSPAVPAIKAATGATVYAEGPHRAARPLHIGERNPLDASGDRDFRPDVALKDGEVVARRRLDGRGGDHARPHRQPHGLCLASEKNVLFSGDHVMGWATSIVAPPDGAMSDYMASLDKLAKRGETDLFPRPRAGDRRRPALRHLLHPAPQGARGLDPASAGEGRDRHPVHRARDLYRHRSAAHRRGRPLGAGASGGPGGARAVATDGVPAIDGVYRLARLSRFGAALGGFFSGSGARLAAPSASPRRRCRRAGCAMRAALVPKSCRP